MIRHLGRYERPAFSIYAIRPAQSVRTVQPIQLVYIWYC